MQRLARQGELAVLTGVYYVLAYVGFLLPTPLALLSGVAPYPVLLAGLAPVALAGTGQRPTSLTLADGGVPARE